MPSPSMVQGQTTVGTDFERLQSQAITALRFPLAVGVVLIHCVGNPAIKLQDFSWGCLSAMQAFDIFRTLLSHILPSLAVPAFFVISGYLFFKSADGSFGKNRYAYKLKRRVATLLVPYVVWNVVFLVKKYVSGGCPPDVVSFIERSGGIDILWGSHSIGKDAASWIGYNLHHLTSPIDVPLWFVRDLMVCAIVSPLIYLLVKKFKAAALVLILTPYLLKLWPYVGGISSMSFVMFTVGAYLSVNKLSLVAEARKIRILSYIVYALAVAVQLVFTGKLGWWINVVSPLYTFFGITALINLAADFSLRRSPWAWLSQTSFFIYASHTLFLADIDKLIKAAGIGYTPQWVAYAHYLLLPLCSIATCLLAYRLLQLAFPPFHRLLSGKR